MLLFAGRKMGILQVKVGLVSILSAYTLKIHSKTKLPLTFTSDLVITPTCDIYLSVSEDK